MYDKKFTVFKVRDIEVIVVDDEDNEYLHLYGISIEELTALMDMVFRNGYNVLIRREGDE